MGKKENDKLCIMIIPHTDKVKRLTIPSWLPKAVSIAIVNGNIRCSNISI